MAAINPIVLPLKTGDANAIVGLRKFYTSGNNISKTMIAALFRNAGIGTAYGDQVLPHTLDSTLAIIATAIFSTPVSGAGSEKIRMEFGYHSKQYTPSAEGADPAAWHQQVAVSQAVNTWVAKSIYVATFTLTQANFAAKDHLEYYLKRDPTHVDDTHGQDVLCHALFLEATY